MLYDFEKGYIKKISEWTSSWSGNPKITICIPSKDNLDCLMPCVGSIADTARGHPIDLLVGDTGSSGDTWDFYRASGIPAISISGRFNFSRVCNRMALEARGENLLFLNNDTQAMGAEWVERLLSIRGERVVGAMLLFPSTHAVQHAGVKFTRVDGPLSRSFPYSPTHVGFNVHHLLVSTREIANAPAVTGAFLYTPKDLFLRLGGFDTQYQDDFQDVDYCFEALNAGVPVICDPQIRLTHRMCASRPGYLSTEFWKSDHRIFFHRWKDEVHRWLENIPCGFGGKKGRADMKRILVADDCIPSWTLKAPRTYSLVTGLARLGYKVTLFPTSHFMNERKFEDSQALESLQMQGVEVITWSHFRSLIEERGSEFDVVIIGRPHNWPGCHEICRALIPKTKIIYDTEALFFLRGERQVKVQRVDGHVAQEHLSMESHACKFSDHVIAVSEEEKGIIQERMGVPAEKISIWGFSIPLSVTPNGFEARQNLLFVGGSIHPTMPNGDAIRHFVENVLPKIRSKAPIALNLIGSFIESSLVYPESRGVFTRGMVPDLWEAYNAARVFIVPHRFAAGVPFKLCETMAHGVPAVVTPLIAKQMGITDNVQALVADSDEEFAEKVIRLHEDKEVWTRIRETGIDFISQKYNPPRMLAELGEIIEKVCP